MIYDRFQEEAINYASENNSVIVSAPTGAGKTVIAEYIIQKCIQENTGIIYTAPIKALSNQKFRDFTKIYNKSIGILTGDVSLNAFAPVLIMTTEIFRNSLLENAERFKNTSWVIFDEVHYLDDLERGTVWEESIMLTPSHMRILALSATIPNVGQLASWIQKVHNHPVKIVIEKERPVPLHHSFQSQNMIFSNYNQFCKNVYKHQHVRSKQQKKFRHQGAHPNKLAALFIHLGQEQQMPAIYFAFSRKRCEELAFETKIFNFLDEDERKKITEAFNSLLKRFNLEKESSAQKIWPLIKKGIAYHHAGLLPSLKEVIEQLFTSRLIKLIFTTETFALGINMPAKTVVFDELRKYYGNYFANLRCRDFYQMAGRAGRRSIDKEGFVYSRINPNRIKSYEVKNIIFGQPEPVISQFNLSYASILHLYERWREQLYNIYPLSFHYFQSDKKFRKNALDFLHFKIALLKDMRYIEDQTLTAKGKFAYAVYGYELLLSELYEQGILETFSASDLNFVLSSLVFEPRKNQIHCKLDSKTLKIQKQIQPVYEAIIKKEKKFKLHSFIKKPYFNLASAIEYWAYGSELTTLKAKTSIDEGEMVRYFRMVIQILRQLRGIETIPDSFRNILEEAIKLINRDEIDAEKQLREGI
ncbi:MAG: DEAD/DEAH box helicase [Candidatus Omnitrophica bacterium]|nr:DEAD/DEAH box helicase [Candidatus Omnitrophota bacterium]